MTGESSTTLLAEGAGLLGGGGDATARMPLLRKEPRTADPTVDGVLHARLMGEWSAQNHVMRQRDLSIEENVSFLSNRQWIQYNEQLGRHFDVSEWMTDEERRYRQRPVVNLLLPWFTITHARLTENPPVLTFVPGPDEKDAQLAEVQDTLFKLAWKQAGMTEVIDRLYAWLIPSGEVYWMSRIDLTKGAFRPRVGRTRVELLGPDGQPLPGPDGTGDIEADNVPLGEDWAPAAYMDAESGQLVPTAEPYYDREGQVVVDVLPAPCVRGQFGAGIPWHEKAWHMCVGFYTPEQVWDIWGVEVEPDASGSTDINSSLEALLFGHGHFLPGDTTLLSQTGPAQGAKRGLVKVWQYWQRPSMRDAATRQTPTSPGGRYTVFTATRILVDGTRPVAYPYTSPIRRATFLNIPGRPAGTSPQSALNGPQRTYNKRRGQLGEHATLTANPKALIDSAAGLEEGQWTNAPGDALKVNFRANGDDPIRWMTPPPLGSAVLQDAELARDEIETIGALKGTGGEPMSPDESGEARKERRYDSDRYVGPTQRRMTEEMARMAEDWMALFPLIYDEPRVVRDAGEDNLARSVLVMPQLFEQGNVHVQPDTESMMPESRGERQARLYTLYKDAVLGDPADPTVRQRFLEMSRFPHLSRVARFGTVDAQTADQENGALLTGQPVPVLPFYDHAEHLRIHNGFRKTREYLKLDPFAREAFDLHCAMHEQALAIQQAEAQAAAYAAAAGMPPGAPAGAPAGPPAPGGARPRPSQVRAESMATPAAGMEPPTPPTDGMPGRLAPRVIGTTAAMPAGMGA
ncbi:hypothetical protein [Gemmatimonas sp. UBA7669]|uniref:portal protein n=1 Tax=Gemmatimonas sp. UBA7669 TaxID=1946568 RepID=UPI0025C56949|nr:hypothetical protein [Gemmatimonas sp. UBA7669]